MSKHVKKRPHFLVHMQSMSTARQRVPAPVLATAPLRAPVRTTSLSRTTLAVVISTWVLPDITDTRIAPETVTQFVVHFESVVGMDAVRFCNSRLGTGVLVRDRTYSRVVAPPPRNKQRQRDWANLIEFPESFGVFRRAPPISPNPVAVSPKVTKG